MIYVLILSLNILLLLIYRADNRYWLVTIPIWTLLFISFIIWRTNNDKQISRLNTAYWQSADENKIKDSENFRGDNNIWKNLEDSKAYVKEYNSIFLNSIFFQTILTFITQLVGYKTTRTKKTYKWTSITFGIVLTLNVWLEIMMGIVPTGPFF
jgi:hypothetical protein